MLAVSRVGQPPRCSSGHSLLPPHPRSTPCRTTFFTTVGADPIATPPISTCVPWDSVSLFDSVSSVHSTLGPFSHPRSVCVPPPRLQCRRVGVLSRRTSPVPVVKKVRPPETMLRRPIVGASVPASPWQRTRPDTSRVTQTGTTRVVLLPKRNLGQPRCGSKVQGPTPSLTRDVVQEYLPPEVGRPPGIPDSSLGCGVVRRVTPSTRFWSKSHRPSQTRGLLPVPNASPISLLLTPI